MINSLITRNPFKEDENGIALWVYTASKILKNLTALQMINFDEFCALDPVANYDNSDLETWKVDFLNFIKTK